MTIFLTMKRIGYSGAAKMFKWLITTLSKQPNMHITVFTYKPSDDNIILPDNVTWIYKDLSKKSFLTRIREMRRELKNSDADVSISFLLDANIFNIISCLGIKTKSVICERLDPYKKGYYKIKIVKPLFALAGGSVYQLKKVSEFYNNIKGPTAVIPNPILSKFDEDIPQFLERDKVIINLARLDIKQKRQDLLIRAFAEFNKSYPEYELHLWGDGDNESDLLKLQELARQLSVEKKVKFPGVTTNSKDVIKRAQLYAFASDSEGIPNSVIEAMQVGLPCVSTKCSPGGAELLIQDGVNGFLVERGDYHSLCNKLKYLVEHPIDADRIGLEAKKISETFSEDRITELWMSYLRNFEK